MGRDEDDARARNEELRRRVDSMAALVDTQRDEMRAVYARLASSRSHAWSSDRLVRVTVNSAGVVTGVEVTAEAFRDSTPEKLGRAMTEAAQQAARIAQQTSADIVAPIAEAANDIADSADFIPGASGLRELRESFYPHPAHIGDDAEASRAEEPPKELPIQYRPKGW